MNEVLESAAEYEVSFEEADRLEDEPLEIACENKLGYIALCASCPLVAMFGECPKEIRNDIVTPESANDEIFDADSMIDSGVGFGAELQPQLTEVSEPLIELPSEPAKRTAASIVVEEPAPKLKDNRAIEQAAEPKVASEKQPTRSYLELLFDDSVSLVVAPALQPRKKEVMRRKYIFEPGQQVPQFPVASKKEQAPLPVTKKLDIILPVVHEQPVQEVTVPEPLPNVFVVEPPIKRPGVIKKAVADKIPEIKAVSVAPQIKPPKQKITLAPPANQAKVVTKVEAIVTNPVAPEILQPIAPVPTVLVAEDHDNKSVLEIAPAGQPVEEVVAIEAQTPVQITTATIEPAQEDQDIEVELAVTVVGADEDIQVKPLYFEEQFTELDTQHDEVGVPDTPEVLLESTAQPVASMLRNIKLLLGSFVLKITL